jgi:hypothetical protein
VVNKTRNYQVFEQGTKTIAQVQTALNNLTAQGWIIIGFTSGANGYAIIAYQDVYA